jgi:nitrogenase molybdenum-cofactor synthesis protein NifE
VWQQVRIAAPWGDDGETLGAVNATVAPSALAPSPAAIPA